ncbi:TetR/AcrR family transcriptional regulator [Bacillus massiliigorillae]|uniref:TetR/AcrR family transcriptional regulator n=1 Tax=Bacillus massiliigorillae TaxID=1243664 RepID=UPI0003A7C885|nr:TetR/AcrR family transcriptional regulator [Bacillus massiliigorillae]
MSNKRDSRESILEAASRLFNLQGYHATGLNQILKESGAPKGSLYYHFPNGKEQLAIEAVQSMSQIIKTDTKEKLALYSDPVEAFQHLIQELSALFDRIDELEGVPIGLLAAETSLKSEPLRKACQSAFEGIEAIYAQKLIKNGYTEERANDISIVISSMIEGSITRSLTNKNGQPLLLMSESIPLLLKR